jgi:hypothetical protein
MRQCLLCILLIMGIFAQEPPSEVLNVVKDELRGNNFLYTFESSKVQLGFKKSTRLSDVKAGVPIQILRINWKFLKSAIASDPVSSIVEYVDSWYVPLLEKDKVITFLNVSKKDSKWLATGLGYSGLCCGWKKVLKYWPSPKYHASIIAAGYNLYFNIIEKGDYNLTKIIPFPCPNEISHNAEYVKNNPVPDYKKLTPSSITIRALMKQ